jgi:hypothetical protein
VPRRCGEGGFGKIRDFQRDQRTESGRRGVGVALNVFDAKVEISKSERASLEVFVCLVTSSVDTAQNGLEILHGEAPH